MLILCLYKYVFEPMLYQIIIFLILDRQRNVLCDNKYLLLITYYFLVSKFKRNNIVF